MRFLDEKGRIFGRVNLIDLLVVVAVVVFAAWLAYAKFGKDLRADVSRREQPIEITVVAANVRPTTAEAIRNSKDVFEFKTGARVGEVVGVETQPADIWFIGGDGRWVRTKADDRVDAYVTIRGNARLSEDVITMNGVEVRVGTSIGLKSKLAVFTGYIVKMNLETGAGSR